MTKVTEEQAKEIAVQQVPGNVKGIRLEQKMKKYICNRNREKCK